MDMHTDGSNQLARWRERHELLLERDIQECLRGREPFSHCLWLSHGRCCTATRGAVCPSCRLENGHEEDIRGRLDRPVRAVRFV